MPIEEAIKYNPKDDLRKEAFDNAFEVINNITIDFFDKCNSIAELAKYLDDIKSLKYVEDAYCTNLSLFVKIKEFSTISFSYFPEEDYTTDDVFKSFTKGITATRADNNYLLPDFSSAVVINQQFRDEKMDKSKSAAIEVNKMLNNIGVKSVINNEPTTEFFRNDLFDYDIIFLITHGGYDPIEKHHWLVTSEEVAQKDRILHNPFGLNKSPYESFKDYDIDEVSFSVQQEKRNGVEVDVCYTKVSEKFISSSKKRFTNKSIIFNTACQSLKGGNKESDVDENLRDFSLAKSFTDKGAGVYYGYDETNNQGQYGGMLFFSKITTGISLEKAYLTLPVKILNNVGTKDEDGITKNFVADLIAYYPKKDAIDEQSVITIPQLISMNNNSTNYEINYLIKAKANYNLYFLYFWDQLSWVLDTPQNKDDFQQELIRYGFEISESEDFRDTKKVSSMTIGDENCTLVDSNNYPFSILKEAEMKVDLDKYLSYLSDFPIVSFSQNLTDKELKPETYYYYRAYFFDGENYYYSRPDWFNTPKIENGNTEDPKDTGDTTNNAQTQNVPGSDL